MDAKTVDRILEVIEKEIVPKTREGVCAGSKLFGAAVLRKSDLSTVVASTNDELQNPLFHGEVSAINAFYKLGARPDAKDCIFVATHEPCSLCLSAITWSGFDNFCYYFTYEDSRQEFQIPYDIDILEQVYRVPDPGRPVDPQRELYNKQNKYFTSTALKTCIQALQEASLLQRATRIESLYRELSEVYQKSKGRLVLA